MLILNISMINEVNYFSHNRSNTAWIKSVLISIYTAVLTWPLVMPPPPLGGLVHGSVLESKSSAWMY